MSDDDVTEFVELDPDSMHLVPKGANNFPFLLAKGAAEAMDEVLTESRGHQPKGNTMKTSSGHPALKELEDRVAKAVESGSADAIRTARRQLTAAKMVAQENARARGGTSYSRFGPNSAELFKNTENIGDDVALHGI